MSHGKIAICILLGLGFLISSCCKTESSTCPENLQAATIISQDFRRCVCCGGWFIAIGQDTLRAMTLPDDFGLDQTHLPLEVCLSFHALTGTCEDFGNLIVVDQMIKR